MKFKHVPPAPDSLDFVETAQRAVPLVPGSEDDCCARMLQRTDLVSRDQAATWLTFLRAVGLAEEGPSGFSRIRQEPTREHLQEAFLAGVFGAEDVLTILREADEPLTADAVFERYREQVPQWERHKNPNTWEEVWSEKVEFELGWLALLDLAERTDDGYRAA
ncbi:hypothetical protein [Haloarchaeobius amylolyticus]|uniref:hypothetical protein n=1 Tax=Haloarchaeobius amylolyticus TaxID=1198296 RepID=UPI002271E4B3